MTEIPSSLDLADVAIVRLKLSGQRSVPQPDVLGRSEIGYAPDLTPDQLWDRGRGVWKARLTTVAESDLAVLVADGEVVLVGTIDGVTFHEGRVAITGRPLPDHPLIGQPDPLPNDSRNPVAYGEIRTAPPSAFPAPPDHQRPYADVLSDAVRVLTEAVRLRRPVYQPTPTGGWEPHPTQTEPADWAEFVANALAGAASNAGGIEAALAGRPGSWEADFVRQLLVGTVGADEKYLWAHRTEPLALTLYVDEILSDIETTNASGEWVTASLEYDQAAQEIDRRRQAATEAEDDTIYDTHLWHYDRTDDGTLQPRDPAAPPWSWEAFRAGQAARDVPADLIARIEESLRTGIGLFSGRPEPTMSASMPKSPEHAAELDRLEAERDARMATFDDLDERLEQQRLREWQTYGETLKTQIETAADALEGLDVPITITIDINTYRLDRPTPGFEDNLENRLIEAAIENTTNTPVALPGTPLDRLTGNSSSASDSCPAE